MNKSEINKKIPILFQKLNNYEIEDTRFIKVKIWLMHLEENLNGSYFSKEVVENAIYSLANTPILAYIEDNSANEKDASDHRVILVKEDGQFKTKYIGQAVGIIPETNNAQFENRICDDGIEREFLTVEGLMWTKFDDPIDIMVRDVNKAESMELHDTYEGEFKDDNLFHFSSFQFYGACILGKKVLPGMMSASIELQFSYDEFKKDINEKIEQFKRFSKNQSSVKEVNDMNISNKGGITILDKFELITKYENLTEEDIADLKINHEQYTLEEFDLKLKELSDTKSASLKTDFALTTEQLTDEIRKVLRARKVIVEDWWGDEYTENEFYYRDIKDDLVIVIDSAWENFYGVPYAISGDSVTLDFDNKISYMYDWRPKIDGEVVDNFAKQEFEEKLKAFTDKATSKAKTETSSEYEVKIKEVQDKLDTATTDYSKLNTELETLKTDNTSLSEFKAKIETAQQEQFELQQKQFKTELIENFSKVLTTEEIKSVTDKDLSIEDMEKEFKLIYADKDLSTKFTKKSKKTETEIPISFNFKKKDDWTSCIKK